MDKIFKDETMKKLTLKDKIVTLIGVFGNVDMEFFATNVNKYMGESTKSLKEIKKNAN